MRIDGVYNIVVDILRKQKNGSVKVVDFNTRAYPAVLDAYNFFQKDYGINQQSHDSLAPFKLTDSFTSDSNGLVLFPDDYARLLNLKPNGSMYAVDFYNEDEIDLAVNSEVRKISTTYFVGELGNKMAQLYPKQTVSGTITYFRLPKVPVYNFTLSGADGRTVTYNPTGSQDIEFDDADLWKVIQGILVRCGVNLSDEMVMQYSQLAPQQNAVTA